MTFSGLLASTSLANPPGPPVTEPVDVNVTNPVLQVEVSNADPLPVTIQNPGPGGPVEVYSTLPEFYRVIRTVFGPDDDRTKRVPVTESVILYDILTRTNSIRGLAGCNVDVYIEQGGDGGTPKFIFETTHYELDTSVSRDGQKTQQRLGRGLVVPAGDNIVIRESYVTDSDIPSLLPNAFCSAQVQIFGEVIQN